VRTYDSFCTMSLGVLGYRPVIESVMVTSVYLWNVFISADLACWPIPGAAGNGYAALPVSEELRE
jgi:hypothetical protein